MGLEFLSRAPCWGAEGRTAALGRGSAAQFSLPRSLDSAAVGLQLREQNTLLASGGGVGGKAEG